MELAFVYSPDGQQTDLKFLSLLSLMTLIGNQCTVNVTFVRTKTFSHCCDTKVRVSKMASMIIIFLNVYTQP